MFGYKENTDPYHTKNHLPYSCREGWCMAWHSLLLLYFTRTCTVLKGVSSEIINPSPLPPLWILGPFKADLHRPHVVSVGWNISGKPPATLRHVLLSISLHRIKILVGISYGRERCSLSAMVDVRLTLMFLESLPQVLRVWVAALSGAWTCWAGLDIDGDVANAPVFVFGLEGGSCSSEMWW